MGIEGRQGGPGRAVPDRRGRGQAFRQGKEEHVGFCSLEDGREVRLEATSGTQQASLATAAFLCSPPQPSSALGRP